MHSGQSMDDRRATPLKVHLEDASSVRKGRVAM